MSRAPFAFKGGNPSNSAITLFMLCLFSVMVGGMSQMREFVKESEIYRRERLVNLRIFPYVTSKLWVAVVLALWQSLAYTVMHYLAFKMPGGLLEFGEVYITLVIGAFAGEMLGLLASALSPNAASAPLTLIMMIVPLIVLSGALAPIPPNVSQIASTRWTFQSMMGITGLGSDVAADPCWHLNKTLRDSMDLDAKTIFQCKCMGVKMFNQKSCNFPGNGDFYVAQIDEAAPVQPPPMPEQPAEPVIPTAPDPPADKYNQVQMAQYLDALVSYQGNITNIQDDYRNQMELYKTTADVYKSQMTKYQYDLATYSIARVSSTKAAEGVIKIINDKYGWSFVNKKDPATYFPWLLNTWFAQFVIVSVYFVLILILIKRKDIK
jgi:hypothetical protein